MLVIKERLYAHPVGQATGHSKTFRDFIQSLQTNAEYYQNQIATAFCRIPPNATVNSFTILDAVQSDLLMTS